ncbi:mevalonate kinase [Flavobacterium sp. 7E]|uniref:GYDIA family GHMP kinase n=1 Tax=unclassified Flavobacterium TaxID=196869 RepID=UPI0015704EF4|nr:MULTISPECIES: GYDIA family GHMP kinase [unclassified Flavobacterium]MBE0392577.1 hypothetical protein [Flavobacterium sp. PL002]NRS89011.1 mevalonate kinase [Flavobacterium sp. 7E]
MKNTYYSNGKLLITGEYLVLDGAKAFALPTKFGQSLTIEQGDNQVIHWKSYDNDKSVWFEDCILFNEIIAPKNSYSSVKDTLITILHQAYLVNPNFINNKKGYRITTELTFPRKWGLGTSSTLINNIAQWLEIDAFELLNTSFGGSGYDIACAQNNNPIIYQLDKGKPVVKKVNFDPEFTKNIYFVYLNKKQSSKNAIANYQKNKSHHLDKDIATINAITIDLLNATNIEQLNQGIVKHEAKMSHILETTTIKESIFPDFHGEIKSLGAWGGDFVMVTSSTNPKIYFSSRGFETFLTYEEMIF